MQIPPIFCVSGIKNSGKTSLILKLMDVLKEDYKNIGVIKHDGHEFRMDHEGTDTDRFNLAGANKIAIFSEKKSVLIHNQPLPDTPQSRVQQLISQMDDMDLIIIEGMKQSPYPKIEIVRSGISNQCVCRQDTLIAVASDTQVINLSEKIPVFPLNDVKGLAEAVKSYLKL